MNKVFNALSQINNLGCAVIHKDVVIESGPFEGLKVTPDQILLGDKTNSNVLETARVIMKFNLREKTVMCICDKDDTGNFREIKIPLHEFEKHLGYDIQKYKDYADEWRRQHKFEKAVTFSFVMQNEPLAKLFTTLHIPKVYAENTYTTFKPTWYHGVIEVYESYFDEEQNTFVDKSMSVDEHEFIVLTQVQLELLTLNAQITTTYPHVIQEHLNTYSDGFTKITSKAVCKKLKERAFCATSFKTDRKIGKKGKIITKYYKPTLCTGVFEVSTQEKSDNIKFVILLQNEFDNMSRQELDL